MRPALPPVRRCRAAVQLVSLAAEMLEPAAGVGEPTAIPVFREEVADADVKL
jgi:hypothetical protein